jgi:PBP1b-binding outer membrane lipoprotein LpoB
MKIYLKVIAICMLGLISGCMGVESRTAFNAETDFTALKTYAWMPGLQEKFSNPEYAGYYMDAMNSHLASKGFKLDTENPDFLIRTHHTKDHREIYSTSSGKVEFHEGMISMEFVDAKSGEAIWEGAAKTYLSEESKPNEVKKDIYEVVENLIKGFPPEVQK